MILRIVAYILILAFPVSSWAAIAFVSQTDATATQNVSSVTFSQVVSAGTDRGLFVCSQARHNATPGKSITSVSFNGSEAFTKVRADARAGVSNAGFTTELWYLVAPTVTNANVVITYSGANVDAIGASATLLTGVSQTSPVDSQAGSSGTGTTPSAIITTVADNAWILDCVIGRDNSGLTVGAGQTMRTDRLIGSVVIDGAGVSTVNGKTPAGAETMDWTQAGQDWAISTVSITPSGGVDPNPVVPGQVTLAWTNGTDPGTISSGIANTVMLRCTGSTCDGTAAPALATVAWPLTGYVDTTVQPNTSYGYSSFHTDGAGNKSTSAATVRITTSGTPPATPPTIANVVYDNAGVTITPGAVTPTNVKVWSFTDQKVVTSVTSTWASLTAGRYNQTWFDGLQGSCVSAIGSTGIENLANGAYLCVNLFNLGLVAALDITPPTLTCPTPINLPFGVTSWTFSCTVNKANTGARFNASDTTYDSMTTDMDQNALTFSGTVTGLTNNSTTTRYVRGTTFHPFDIDANGVPINYPNTTSLAVVINVAAAAGDVTPPNDVSGLAATLLGTSVSFTWTTPVLDAVSYQLFQASGDCSTYTPSGQATAPPMTISSLAFGTVYCWKIKALDVVNNLSTNFSSVVTKTTPAAPDIERPSDLIGMTVGAFTSTVQLSWTPGTDNSGQVLTNIEYCAVATGQMDCANFSALVSQFAQTFLTPSNLNAGARYCFRGKNADPSGNVSLNYNTAICATTPTKGLSAPRGTLQFGQDRATGSRGTAGTRAVRP